MQVGPAELLLVLAVLLVITGGHRLPDLANSLGRSLREFRSAVADDEHPDDVVTPLPRDPERPEPPPPAA